MISRRRGLRRRGVHDSTLSSRRRANEDRALIWNWYKEAVMRIAVVGAGALGLFYGALLQRAGNDVRVLLRRDYEAIMAKGLQVFSTGGDFHLPTVAGARTPEEIGPVDLVLVGLKTFANGRFAELIPSLLHDTTTILTLQNGL